MQELRNLFKARSADVSASSAGASTAEEVAIAKESEKIKEWKFVDSHERNKESKSSGTKIFTGRTQYMDANTLANNLDLAADRASWTAWFLMSK